MMKQTWKKAFSLTLALVFTLALVSCGGGGTDPTPGAASHTPGAEEDKILIGWALKTLQEERWQKEVDTMEKVAAEMGVEFVCQTANGDSQLQITQIENMVTQGVDVLIITAADAASLTSTVEAAHSAGVKILCYDQQFINAYADAYVGTSDVPLGHAIAKILVDENVSGNVVILSGDQASGQCIPDMFTGMTEEIAELDVEVVMHQYCKEWKSEEALAYTENALSQYNNDIAAIIANNDGIASGAIQALEAQGLDGKVVVTGMDSEVTALQRIAAGTQSSTLYRDLNKFATKALETAVKLAKGEEVVGEQTANFGVNDCPWVLLDVTQVTKDNLDAIFIDTGIYTHEEIYGS